MNSNRTKPVSRGMTRPEARRDWASRSIAERLLAPLYARQNPVVWAFNILRSRGLRGTFSAVARAAVEVGFDLRHGTDTVRWVEMNTLGFESEHKKYAIAYAPTPVRPLRTLLRKLDLPKYGVFVDLGSGKGRVLLIAAQAGFQRIIGVEFSPELCEIARENVKAFARNTQTNAQIEVVEADVASYSLQPESNVFFMYHPFEKAVLARFLTNLQGSLAQFPRKIWLIYNNPVHGDAISDSGLFRACQEFEPGGAPFPFKVYHN